MKGRKKAPRGLGKVVYTRVTAGLHDKIAKETRRRSRQSGKKLKRADVVRSILEQHFRLDCVAGDLQSLATHLCHQRPIIDSPTLGVYRRAPSDDPLHTEERAEEIANLLRFLVDGLTFDRWPPAIAALLAPLAPNG